jgi:glutaredoxin 3
MGVDMDHMEITIYAKRKCPYCWCVKRLLRRKGYAFKAVDVTKDNGLRAWFASFIGPKMVPYVFVDHRPVGDFKIIQALERSGDRDRLVRGEV